MVSPAPRIPGATEAAAAELDFRQPAGGLESVLLPLRRAWKVLPRSVALARGVLRRPSGRGFEEAHAVLACLAGLAGRRPKAAASALAELVHRRGLERASEVLFGWASY